jgi:glycosyltransferase involved in cell wall biosynthesis
MYITDSRVVQGYYRDRFGYRPPYIPYGSEVDRIPPGETLAQFDLEPGKYILFVGRLVPENCAHHLVEAFKELDTDLKCVIVGDAAYAKDYITSLKASAEGDPRIVFTGYVFGKGYHELGSNAHIFVETSGVGGTHPALTEAMAFGNCVIVHNTSENLETIGDAGLAYEGKEGASVLKSILRDLLKNPETVKAYSRKAQERARRVYSWESVTDAYERLCYEITGRSLPERLRNVQV